ncbi:hypothetical protein ACFXOY_27370 [Streptomyces niveus]|uniref:hypothetical protein n=1 Tax=Streptomyces niveus TaxID=193462 RepID=UPI0036BE1775
MSRVWLVTGANSGFGRAITEAAVAAERTPLRLPLGPDAVDAVTGHLDAVRAEVAAWEEVARDTGFDS